MVLLHGFLEDGTIWDRYVDHLSKKYFLIVLDLPGHGKSGVVAKTHSMELMAEAVYELLQLLKIDTVVLVGHSMGGYVSLAFAEMHPETLSGLVLLNSTPEADGPERIENRNRALEMIPKEKEKIIGMALSNLFSENARTLYCDEIKKLKQQANGFATEGILANIRGMRDRKDRTSILTAVSKTKWLLCGDQDPVVPLKTSRNVSKKTGTPIQILHGSHMGWLENEANIKDFLLFVDFFYT
ncbi:MAG TPA: alpha/beta hydrolase [Flavobacteriaceae bacterium]|nr:alpha/beta hydrolase [Flavobacteriaceae bacterium]MCB9212695.1 alpha/beta hydrolase [Alteromonas sp.]HPF11790.1 alpha/beta hydrolase [Flavobacteriaceae bacterium]HQU20816.1 alpha/beta hydrolase [Flavobacteriaceae bacterium]HQU64991.1 alpha/beta hydrolase [Flavobacteriaceae bacterium]